VGEEVVMQLGSDALKTTILLAGPMLIAAMLIGLLVSVVQALTQINEATLTFIPKMVAVVLILVLMGPWMLEVMKNYTTEVISGAGDLIH
jgi:flagellar biosynthetic protein FliQ